MNKSHLVAEISEKTDVSKAVVAQVIDEGLEAIKRALAAGDTVTLVGFGSWDVKERAARTGRHPSTGKVIEIKASKAPRFKAGKGLKDAVAD